MSDEAVLLPTWLSHQGTKLAKEQLHHSYTFWAMPILIFSPVYFFLRHPILHIKCKTEIVLWLQYRSWKSILLFIAYLVTILKALMRNITKLKDDFKNNSAPLHCAIEKKRDTNPLFSHQYVSRLQKRQIGAYISQITLKNWQDIFSKLKKIQNFATFICQFYCYP